MTFNYGINAFTTNIELYVIKYDILKQVFTPSHTNMYSVRWYFCFPGTKGRNKGEFTNLQGVAASSLGKVLIADSNNQCVQVTNPSGALR